MDFDNPGPKVAIQIDRQSLRVFSQANIDAGRTGEADGRDGNDNNQRELDNG